MLPTPSVGVSTKFAGCAGCACWLVWQRHQNSVYVLFVLLLGNYRRGTMELNPRSSRLNPDHFWSLPLFSSCDGVNPKGHRRINKGLIYISIVGVFWSCFTRGYQPTELLHSGHIQTKKQNIKHDLRNQRFCFEHSKPGSCKLGSARLSGAQRDSAGLRAFFAT